MELFKAHRQWASRPADERFGSVQALYDATKAYAAQAREKDVQVAELRTEAIDGDVKLVGRANVPARLTHWAFGQLAARVAAPAAYLRELPATLAVQNLNHGLKALAAKMTDAGRDAVASLMFHSNGGLLLRAVTSDRYERIWNHEVAERLLGLESRGWTPATPDRVWSDEQQGITALYASDHDLFAFLKSSTTVAEAGSTEPLYRGVIVENSEVGASALKLTRFLYRYMCGNHIIWGASKVTELSLRHVGVVRERMQLWNAELKRYAEESASEEEGRIAEAKRRLIGATKEEVLDVLFGKRSVGLSRKVLEAGFDATLPEEDGDPRTAWGVVQGLTRYSQETQYADERTRIDRAAGRILDLVF